MKSYFIFLSLIGAIIAIKPTFAQLAQVTEERHSVFYSTTQVAARQGEWLNIQLSHPFTSISIEIPVHQSFENLILLAEGQSFALTKDIHAEANLSNLIVFDQPIIQFQLQAKDTKIPLKLHLINAPPLPKSQKTWENITHRIEEECEKPAVITGAQWRTGLPPPKESPIATPVKHVIIHHASGSNTATNFTEVIRNIYLLHTQTNGWNDIGYNYLIAQDGTVFEGRLGQGTLESDNVLGAHFCGKNTNTMGICLLGDYQTAINPTQATLNALYRLIAWKLKKENLFNPLAAFMHPQGATDAKILGVISGHRDGCATDCPGDNVYRQLAQIKANISTVCTVLANEESVFGNELKIYPQPCQNELFIFSKKPVDKIVLHDLTGRKIYDASFVYFPLQEKKISLNSCSSGIYILKIFQEGKVQVRRLVVEK